MSVTLSPELERLIAEEVADGGFTSSEAVLGACLYVLKSQRELRAAILAGLEQIENGQCSELDPVELLAEVRAKRQMSSAPQ